ncbi:uncharacterized protein LOC107367951 [Tetranychus urticae]|uniref:DNA/RNA-binding domain-containing protein n=1 Tax=Tetranychus urticae TaxID=32264 RepID=T1KWB5_TETUR|nr:uncharacterized protein LOC107367951 [Tetranychus urticae]
MSESTNLLRIISNHQGLNMSNQSLDEKQKNVATLCEQYLQKLVNKLKQQSEVNDSSDPCDADSSCAAEIQLWNQLKKYIETHEGSLINCIHGFYVYILQVLYSLIKGPAMDLYFIRCKFVDDVKLKEADKLLFYNIYIRLGDLNRYLKNLKVSRYYYYQACEIDPSRGHAYNQLALVTTSQVFNSLYYSVRALMATDDPIKMAKNNIDSLVNRCSLMNPNIEPLFLNDSSIIDADRVENWLHFIVIAIYCEKLKIVLPYLIKELDKNLTIEPKKPNENILIPKFDTKWIFSAMDVAIDIILSHPSDEKLSSIELDKELSDIKGKLTILLKDKTCTADKVGLALKHDYLLYGFSPLKEAHKVLSFSEPLDDLLNTQLLLLRINEKLEKLIVLTNERKVKNRVKKSRNIALQSILGSKGSS